MLHKLCNAYYFSLHWSADIRYKAHKKHFMGRIGCSFTIFLFGKNDFSCGKSFFSEFSFGSWSKCIHSIFKAFGIFDPTYHGIMRALYDDAVGEYGRKVPHDSAVIADAVTNTDASPNSEIVTTSSATIIILIHLFSTLF